MKFLFNTALLKEQLKRYWAIGALTMLVYILCCLMPIWGTNYVPGAIMSMMGILEMRHPFVLMMNIIAPLAAVLVIYSYMYRQNSTSVIHSQPFTKTQLFATNLLAGYLLIVIPLLIFSVLLLIVPVQFDFGYHSNNDISYMPMIAVNIFPKGLPIGTVINTVPAVCGFFARTMLSFTFYYVLFVMAAMIVGNQVLYIILSALIPFLALGFYLLFGLISAYFVFGFYFDSKPFEYILTYTNPIVLCSAFTTTFSNTPYSDAVTNLIPLYAVYISLSVAMLAVSVWLYRTRKLERAGDTIVFTPLKNFFIFLLAITGMISLGAVFLAFFKSVFIMYVGFVIGFIAAFFIAQMIVEKTFNVFYKYKALLKHGCVIIGLFVATVIITRADLTGYVRHVPNVSEIEGVFFGRSYNFEQYLKQDDILDRIFISDPEIITKTMTLHKKVIDNRQEQRKVFLNELSSNYRSGYIQNVYQNIAYRLKNGKIVMREYNLSDDFYIESGLRELMLTETVILSDIYWVNYLEDVESITLNPYRHEITDNGYSSVYSYFNVTIYDRNEMASLTEALKQDYITYKTYRMMNKDLFLTDIRFNVYVRLKDEDMGTNRSSSINNNSNIEYGRKTIEWLESHGYELIENN